MLQIQYAQQIEINATFLLSTTSPTLRTIHATLKITKRIFIKERGVKFSKLYSYVMFTQILLICNDFIFLLETIANNKCKTFLCDVFNRNYL